MDGLWSSQGRDAAGTTDGHGLYISNANVLVYNNVIAAHDGNGMLVAGTSVGDSPRIWYAMSMMRVFFAVRL